MKPFYDSSPKWEQSSLSNPFRLIFICLTALLIVTLSFPKIIHAAQITLEWDAVIHSLLEGYVVHYGTYSEGYDVSLDVGNWTSCTIADLEEGEAYYFAVTAYSTEGEESDFSNEVSNSSSNSSKDSSDVGIGGGCFIATAAYGSAIMPQVKVQREFHERYLLTNPFGQAFVDFYYAHSPPVADFISEHIGPAPTMAFLIIMVTSLIYLAGYRREFRS